MDAKARLLAMAAGVAVGLATLQPVAVLAAEDKKLTKEGTPPACEWVIIDGKIFCRPWVGLTQ